jgi:soluble lytic murein transglycosylase
VRQWVREYGDPRSTAVDPIDWIESIPFSETRNYVQRVMENMEVYRGRLSGQPEAVRIEADLRRYSGSAPITTPPPAVRPTNVPLAPPSSASPVVTRASNTPIPAAIPAAGAMTPVVEAGDR